MRMLEDSGVEYAVLGSCGYQSYFEYFYRLPNDLDVVVTESEMRAVLAVASARGYRIIEQRGRKRLVVDTFPVHLIPNDMNIVDKDRDVVIAKICLGPYIARSGIKVARLINSEVVCRMRVFPVEVVVFVDLIRPIYTGSLMNMFFVFRDLDIDCDMFARVVASNRVVKEIIDARLAAFPERLMKLKVFSESERESVCDRIRRFGDAIQ
ncbi:MAG: hypothetical protein HYR85_18285 [Planctomycetes bacterium]|nr:hypothetical protein [Planctomycetota bacterium]